MERLPYLVSPIRMRWCRLAWAHENQLYAHLSHSVIPDLMLVTGNWAKYLHYGNWKMLQIRCPPVPNELLNIYQHITVLDSDV